MVVLRVTAFVFGLGGLVALYVLFHFYPAVPKSVAGWIAVLFVAFPFLAALEWVGGVMFGRELLADFSSPIRVLLGAVMLLALLAVILPIAVLIAGLINT